MSTTMVRRIILITCLILAALSLALALIYTPPTDQPAAAIQQQNDGPPYTVKTYQGYVAVFTGDSDTPSKVTGIRAELLPLQDQLDLAEGIPISSKEALSALLEDYGS